MSNEAFAFDSDDAVDRVIKAVRWVERIVASQDPETAPLSPPGMGSVFVNVTGDKYSDDPIDPPDGFISRIGLYPGLIVYRNPESISSDDHWYDLTETCYVEEVNAGDIVVGQRYKGNVIGVRNGLAVIEVEKEGGGTTSVTGDVFGPESAFTGALAFFNNPTGRFIDKTSGIRFFSYTIGTFRGSGLQFTIPGEENLNGGFSEFSSPLSIPITAIATQKGQIQNRLLNWDITHASSINYNRSHSFGVTVGPYDQHLVEDQWMDGKYLSCIETFIFNNITVVGQIFTETRVVGGIPFVIRTYSSSTPLGFQNWMEHYAHDGTPGKSVGAFKDGLLTAQQAAITTLSGVATLSDVITKLNEIITKLQASGLTL